MASNNKNGQATCFFLQKKMTAGWVYVGESTRTNGSKNIYTEMTTRSPYVRWREHIKNVQKGNKSTWVGKGSYFKPIGAVWSGNARKAEKTVKKISSYQKRSFGRLGARRYGRRVTHKWRRYDN